MRTPEPPAADATVTTYPGTGSEGDRSRFERVAFFSDAVFAIAATLLVVDLRIPETVGRLTDGQFVDALVELTPKFYGFAVSIIVICLYWAGHHRTFGRFVRYESGLPYANLPFLICIAFMPFPTAALGQYWYLTSAVLFYAGWQVVTGVAYFVLWIWATRDRRLVPKDVSDDWIRERTWLGATVMLGFVLTAPIALVSPVLTQVAWWPAITLLSVIVTRRFEGAGPRDLD
jgi:uncharacterized membrane protein